MSNTYEDVQEMCSSEQHLRALVSCGQQVCVMDYVRKRHMIWLLVEVGCFGPNKMQMLVLKLLIIYPLVKLKSEKIYH